MGDSVILARKLLHEYPSKAQELLIIYLQDKDIRTATEQYIGQHVTSPVGLDAALELQPRSSRTHSHDSDSPQVQRTTRQNNPDARHGLPTPSTSAGSVKSHASSLAVAGRERIYLVSCDDDGVDQPVIARSALVKHNLIGDRVIYDRNLGASTYSVDELVPVHLLSGGYESKRATTAVSLTWRRRNEFTTNVDTFYIVSARLLDSDVILRSDGSLERQFPSDVQEARSPQARYTRRGFVEMEELDPIVPPHAPTPPVHSYQQAGMPPNVLQALNRVEAFRDSHQMHVAEPSVPAPHPGHSDHGRQTHTATPPAAHRPLSCQIQVTGLWGKTPIKMSFDLDAPGEVFFQDFYQWAVRRNRGGDVERHRMTIWLKASKNTPDDEAYELGLKEGELEELWETAVDWIQENKNPKAPHLYATVELEAT